MYKIYINDLPLLIAHPENVDKFPHSALVSPFINKPKILLNYIDKLEKQNEDYPGIVLTDRNPDEAFQYFSDLYKIKEAGGGLVLNPNDEILFIFRRGHWDLPKGKMEKGESIRETAGREVMEETGLEELRIEDKLCITYHTYRLARKGRILKPTHWFRMRIDSMKPVLKLQTEEDIVDSIWMTKEDFLENYAHKSFRSIVDAVRSL